MDMYMDNLVSLIKESYTSTSYVFLATDSGTILVHPNEEYALSVERMSTVQDVNSGRYESFISNDMDSKLFLDYKGGIKFGIGNTSQVTGWKVISVKPFFTILLFFALILGLNVMIYFIAAFISKKEVQKKILY